MTAMLAGRCNSGLYRSPLSQQYLPVRSRMITRTPGVPTQIHTYKKGWLEEGDPRGDGEELQYRPPW